VNSALATFVILDIGLLCADIAKGISKCIHSLHTATKKEEKNENSDVDPSSMRSVIDATLKLCKATEKTTGSLREVVRKTEKLTEDVASELDDIDAEIRKSFIAAASTERLDLLQQMWSEALQESQENDHTPRFMEKMNHIRILLRSPWRESNEIASLIPILRKATEVLDDAILPVSSIRRAVRS
jgi:hypothetical protein